MGMNSFEMFRKVWIRNSIYGTAPIISSQPGKMDAEGKGSLAGLLLAEHAR
jgi:hypothetical protein